MQGDAFGSVVVLSAIGVGGTKAASLSARLVHNSCASAACRGGARPARLAPGQRRPSISGQTPRAVAAVKRKFSSGIDYGAPAAPAPKASSSALR